MRKERPRRAAAIQVITTTDSPKVARRIADCLVGERLAACVQIVGPLVSTYRWQGRITSTREWLCVVKTRRTLYARVEKRILALHNYTTPEILAVPVVAGTRAYLDWLKAETS